MSGFKFGFNFSGENDAGDPLDGANECAATAASPAVEVAILATLAAPIGPLQDVALGSDIVIRLRRLDSDSATQLIGNPDLAASDIVPGQYEGGLKLWESSVDLAKVLVDRFWSPTAGHGSRCQGMRGMRVMELGCGHGLPGIVCALSGAEVCFQVLHERQDYNSEALAMLTAPNLQLNASLHQVAVAPPRYFSGDWRLLGQLLSSLGLAHTFDMVVSAETIYNTESMTALLTCIKQCLKPGGVAYIAAKTMYFGLDGGSLPFRSLVQRGGGATVRQVAAVMDGVAREVLEVQIAPVAA